jgi:hypothetical protein
MRRPLVACGEAAASSPENAHPGLSNTVSILVAVLSMLGFGYSSPGHSLVIHQRMLQK